MVQLASVVLGIAGLVLTLLGSGITFGGIMLHGMMLAALMTAGGLWQAWWARRYSPRSPWALEE